MERDFHIRFPRTTWEREGWGVEAGLCQRIGLLGAGDFRGPSLSSGTAWPGHTAVCRPVGDGSLLLSAATVLASGHHTNCRPPLRLLLPPGVAREAFALVIEDWALRKRNLDLLELTAGKRGSQEKVPTPPFSHIKCETQKLSYTVPVCLQFPEQLARKALGQKGKLRLPGPQLGHCGLSAGSKVVASPQEGR